MTHVVDALVLGGNDPYLRASASRPVQPRAASDVTLDDGVLRVSLPRASWGTVRVAA